MVSPELYQLGHLLRPAPNQIVLPRIQTKAYLELSVLYSAQMTVQALLVQAKLLVQAPYSVRERRSVPGSRWASVSVPGSVSDLE